MIKQILAILANLSGPLAQLWSGKITQSNTPEAKRIKKDEEIARNITKNDSNAESVRLNDRLRDLRESQNSFKR